MVLELLFEYGEHESSSVAQILNVVHLRFAEDVLFYPKNEVMAFPKMFKH